MKKFLDWLIDNYLSRWIVLRDDYNDVQIRYCNLDYRLRSIERQLIDVMNECYKNYAPIVEDINSKIEFISYVEHDIPAFRWEIRIPQTRFVTMNDFPQREDLLRHFAENATRAIGEHIRTRVFKLH